MVLLKQSLGPQASAPLVNELRNLGRYTDVGQATIFIIGGFIGMIVAFSKIGPRVLNPAEMDFYLGTQLAFTFDNGMLHIATIIRPIFSFIRCCGPETSVRV